MMGRRRRGRAGWAGTVGRCPTDHGPLPSRSASTPETWARFTQENLYRAERERLASVNLRVLIDSILRDTAEDLRLQCDAVNLAFERRCEEVEDARHKLTDHLHKVKPRQPRLGHARPRTSRAPEQATPTPLGHAPEQTTPAPPGHAHPCASHAPERVTPARVQAWPQNRPILSDHAHTGHPPQFRPRPRTDHAHTYRPRPPIPGHAPTTPRELGICNGGRKLLLAQPRSWLLSPGHNLAWSLPLLHSIHPEGPQRQGTHSSLGTL